MSFVKRGTPEPILELIDNPDQKKVKEAIKLNQESKQSSKDQELEEKEIN